MKKVARVTVGFPILVVVFFYPLLVAKLIELEDGPLEIIVCFCWGWNMSDVYKALIKWIIEDK